MAVIEEIIDGSAGAEVNESGLTVVRSFLVDAISAGATEAGKASIWHEALQQLQGAGVQYNAPHPYDATIFCKRIQPTPFGNSRTQVRALATYGPPTSGGSLGNTVRISFDAVVRDVTTNRYPDKSLIYVDYARTDAAGNQTSDVNRPVGSLQFPDASGLLIVEREVTSDPTPRFAYIGHANSDAWRGGAKWTWRVDRFSAEPIPNRNAYFEHWEIAYNPQTYRVPVFAIDKVTGEPYADIYDGYDPEADRGNGYVNVLAARGEKAFGSLGF